MMKLSKNIEHRILKKMEEIKLEIKFHPSHFEDLDMYSASNREYGVESFGQTEAEAIENARIFIKELLFQNLELTR